MSQESTTPDAKLTRQAFDIANRDDIEVLMGFFAPDAVLDLSDLGIGTFDGATAARTFFEDWWATWADHLIEVEDILDLGHGVVFSPFREDGRLVGSDRHVEQRRGFVSLWAQGLIERQTVYLDIDEARAAAERLAQERNDG